MQEARYAGDVIWVKYSGYPFWPARVAKLEEVSPSIRSLKKKGEILVRFFDSKGECAWVKNKSSIVQLFDPANLKEAKLLPIKKLQEYNYGIEQALKWYHNTDKVYPEWKDKNIPNEQASQNLDEDYIENNTSIFGDSFVEEEKEVVHKRLKRVPSSPPSSQLSQKSQKTQKTQKVSTVLKESDEELFGGTLKISKVSKPTRSSSRLNRYSTVVHPTSHMMDDNSDSEKRLTRSRTSLRLKEYEPEKVEKGKNSKSESESKKTKGKNSEVDLLSDNHDILKKVKTEKSEIIEDNKVEVKNSRSKSSQKIDQKNQKAKKSVEEVELISYNSDEEKGLIKSISKSEKLKKGDQIDNSTLGKSVKSEKGNENTKKGKSDNNDNSEMLKKTKSKLDLNLERSLVESDYFTKGKSPSLEKRSLSLSLSSLEKSDQSITSESSESRVTNIHVEKLNLVLEDDVASEKENEPKEQPKSSEKNKEQSKSSEKKLDKNSEKSSEKKSITKEISPSSRTKRKGSTLQLEFIESPKISVSFPIPLPSPKTSPHQNLPNNTTNNQNHSSKQVPNTHVLSPPLSPPFIPKGPKRRKLPDENSYSQKNSERNEYGLFDGDQRDYENFETKKEKKSDKEKTQTINENNTNTNIANSDDNTKTNNNNNHNNSDHESKVISDKTDNEKDKKDDHINEEMETSFEQHNIILQTPVKNSTIPSLHLALSHTPNILENSPINSKPNDNIFSPYHLTPTQQVIFPPTQLVEIQQTQVMTPQPNYDIPPTQPVDIQPTPPHQQVFTPLTPCGTPHFQFGNFDQAKKGGNKINFDFDSPKPQSEKRRNPKETGCSSPEVFDSQTIVLEERIHEILQSSLAKERVEIESQFSTKLDEVAKNIKEDANTFLSSTSRRVIEEGVRGIKAAKEDMQKQIRKSEQETEEKVKKLLDETKIELDTQRRQEKEELEKWKRNLLQSISFCVSDISESLSNLKSTLGKLS